jgi:hypothetical protein
LGKQGRLGFIYLCLLRITTAGTAAAVSTFALNPLTALAGLGLLGGGLALGAAALGSRGGRGGRGGSGRGRGRGNSYSRGSGRSGRRNYGLRRRCDKNIF